MLNGVYKITHNDKDRCGIKVLHPNSYQLHIMLLPQEGEAQQSGQCAVHTLMATRHAGPK